MRRWPALIAVAFSALLSLSAGGGRRGVLYVGGPVHTVDGEDRIVDALWIEGDRIRAAGDAAALRAEAERAGAAIVELEGRAIVPGFIDAHGHFPGPGIYAVAADLNSPPVGAVTSHQDIIDGLAAQAAKTRRGRWVVGWGYDDTLVAEGRHPTRHDLDRVSTEHPVAAIHTSGHLMVLNSRGLERVGYGPDTPDPPEGRIWREPDGRTPSGVLEETASEHAQRDMEPGLLQGLKIVDAAAERYTGVGLTTAQSGLTPQSLIGSLALLSRLGRVPIRLIIWPDEFAAAAQLAGDYRYPRLPEERGRIGAIKLLADGSIQAYTAWLREPYFTPPGEDPDFRGHPRAGALDAQVARLHAAGHQLAIHGNGDAAIDAILDAIEAAQRARPRADARHVVVHAQMATEDQLDRMVELDVTPSFFVGHTYYWGDRHRQIFLGPERAARIDPAASAAARGLRFTLHADAPVVPPDPLDIIAAAVERRTRSGHVLGPDQRLDPARALRAVTLDAAWQHFDEDELGSLEPGKRADFVILSRSPVLEPEAIQEIEVLRTVVAGEIVFEAPEG